MNRTQHQVSQNFITHLYNINTTKCYKLLILRFRHDAHQLQTVGVFLLPCGWNGMRIRLLADHRHKHVTTKQPKTPKSWICTSWKEQITGAMWSSKWELWNLLFWGHIAPAIWLWSLPKTMSYTTKAENCHDSSWELRIVQRSALVSWGGYHLVCMCPNLVVVLKVLQDYKLRATSHTWLNDHNHSKFSHWSKKFV